MGRPTVFQSSRVARPQSLKELAREVARVQGQPAGKEEDSGTSDESGPRLVPNSARIVSGRRHHRLCMLDGHLMRRHGKSKKSRLERRDVRPLAARWNYQTALGTFLKFVKELTLPLVKDVEIDGALVA